MMSNNDSAMVMIEDAALHDIVYDMRNAALLLGYICNDIDDPKIDDAITGVARLLDLSASRFNQIVESSDMYSDERGVVNG